MSLNYEFVPGDEKVIAPGRVTHRIRALTAILALGVAPGDLGGYIERPENLYGDAWVYGDAQVYGDARVCGDAQVCGASDWLLIGPALSSGRFTTACRTKDGSAQVSCGCFLGTVDEFRAAINTTHAENEPARRQYLAFADCITAALP